MAPVATPTREQLLSEINRDFGAGSAFTASSKERLDIRAISTRNVAIDVATGIGGVPLGRVVEIFGPESSGKTSLVWALMGTVHDKGGLTALVDTEHAAELDWAAKFGVQISQLDLSQPDSAEDALNILERYVRSGLYAIVALDSVAALAPKAELAGEFGESTVGLNARFMNQAMRKLVPVCESTSTTLILINQLRSKIGVTYGSNETTTGGNAIKYAASMRLDIRSIEQIKEGTEIVGRLSKVKVVKNKCAPPLRTATFEIRFDEGISNSASLIEAAVEFGIVKKSGAWFTYGEQRWQGASAVRKSINSDPALLEQLTTEVMAKLRQ